MAHGHAYLESTAIGIALKKALADMLDSQKDALSGQETPPELTQEQMEPVLVEFMKTMAQRIPECKTKCRLKGQHSDSLLLYRFCDGCWTFFLKGCNFESMQFRESVDVVKIVAREAEKR